ncbi:MAG: ABC transporter permease [Bacteroidetes bacterium]|nr:MAG: ABC transporter permease [Bacteroidota bacterium]
MVTPIPYQVFVKEVASEFRTRYALNALLMFVVTTLTMVVFSLGDNTVPYEILSGMLWIVIFFSAMSGLSRTFVTEEERGTSLTLRLLTSATNVYIGKFLYNVVLILAMSVFIAFAYRLIIDDFVVRSSSIFWTTIVLGGIGLAAASTILAAIIAKANTKGTLFPVLAFPVLLPLLLTCIRATVLSVEGAFFSEAFKDFQILVSFSVVMIAASVIVFEYVWND